LAYTETLGLQITALAGDHQITAVLLLHCSAMRKLLALLGFAFLALTAAAQTVTLDQNWQLLPDPDAKFTLQAALEQKNWRPVRVGLSWNAQFEDMRDFGGVGWYRTEFTVPQSSSPQVLLNFGACDYLCEVYVNGKKVGEHEGGYTPFSFDVINAVHPGSNALAVRVVDPPQDKQRNQQLFPQFMYDEVPHGKQNWYVQTGGLWQPITLITGPDAAIRPIRVSARNDGKVSVEVTVPVGGPNIASTLTILDSQGNIVTESASRFSDLAAVRRVDFGSLSFSLAVPAPKLWSPDSPYLYSAVFEQQTGAVPTSIRVRFGFRQLTTRDGKLYLNSKPFYMIGALDQDFYPATVYTPPSYEYIRDEMRKAKQLGLNTLRCHIKICTPEYLDAADEVGMLIWYEIPSWNDEHHWTPQAAERGMTTFREALERDWNHPSLMIQSIINESWGADLKQAEQRAWLRSAYDEAKKAVAPVGRLVVDNSACCENFHVKSDLDDFHQYFSIPDHAQKWKDWVADFASRPKWSFSPHGDGARTGQEPLIVSEFGNWGLPKLPHELPWWFNRDFNGREITRPAGVQDRFKQFKFDRIFPDYDALAEATQWHQFESLKYEIEQMRIQPSIQGYVITEFTDINWESNGLLDMWRNPKAYARELSEIQQPDAVVLDLGKRNYLAGEIIDLPRVLSHYSSAELRGATMEWRTEWGPRGAELLEHGESGSVMHFEGHHLSDEDESAHVEAPPVSKPSQRRIEVALRSGNGQVLARNSQVVNVFPRPAPIRGEYAVTGDLPSALRQLVSRATLRAHLLVASKWNQEVVRHLNDGGSVVLLPDSADALPANFAVQLKTRERNNYNGDWISNFNWILPSSPVFNEIAFNKIMGWEAQAVTPDYVLLGVPAANFDDVLAGAFYGWINANSALMLQARYGAGRVLLTTLRFDQYGKDPYATALLDNMIRYAASEQFAPKFRLQ
jgi:Glycosyl hydrolases family 2, sugar binding domain/Glycosyl hydrolases family 2/Glycosyl hydrolases family 2, TIM barrel domain